MDVPSGDLAALHGTQRQAFAVAYAVGVGVAAVGHVVVDVPPRDLAAFHSADGDLGLDLGLGAPPTAAAAVASAAMAVGHSRNHQGQRGDAGQHQNQRPSAEGFARCG